MDISTGGVFFLWFMLLWPVLVVVIYYGLFSSKISYPNVLGVTSVVIGYASFWPVVLLIERFIGIDSPFSLLLFILTPVATTHTLALAFSKKANGIVDVVVT